ncbi:Serine/threonine protein kinase [Parafrankia irregularis]|uniref:non-specific serine/threonine protein kinase n=1 Tax=Parafrankia irregularis TaxID=795642 RepID=A0A0S4QW04_9ACTN|nr:MULTISPECIES: serine/threonine-protein kinase [Parafrankia]MBE3204916.1 serine/threonine protein kinase [Parafrankia sp. CH37]CUU58614.1 Serine/threonine protein kinase [Parafrankia irregularis]
MISGYRFLRDLGHGGFSTVHLAEQEIFDRQVAVKVMHADLRDPDARRRFVRECKATGRLTGNPNIITVFDAGTTVDHRPYIAMEYFPAGTLRDRVIDQGPLPVREVLSLAVPVTRALDAAHRHGILHRDLKPANILLRASGEPVLSDFGIASVAEGLDPATFSAAFTAGFAAPEVLLGDQPETTSDVFGLAATLFALLTDRTPFPGKTPAEIFTRIQAGEMLPLDRPDAPPALDDLLRRMLARTRDQRPGLDEVTAELTSLLAELEHGDPYPSAGWQGTGPRGEEDGEDSTGAPLEPPQRPRPRRQRRSGWQVAAVAGSAALLTAGAVALSLQLARHGEQDDAAELTTSTSSTAPTAAGTSPGAPTSPSTNASTNAGTGTDTDVVSTSTPTPSITAADTCGMRYEEIRDYQDRVFKSQYMCPTDVDSPVYANIGAGVTGPLDDTGLMRKSDTVWVVCQIQGRPNPTSRTGRQSTWWLYTQGDVPAENSYGYSDAWGYLPATAVTYHNEGAAVPGVEPCTAQP